MPYALFLVWSWVGGAFCSQPRAPASPLPEVLTTVLNAPSLAPYLGHYLCRQPVYVRFLSSSARSVPSLHGAKPLTLRVGRCPALVYNMTLDARRHPVVTVQVLHLTPDSARVRIGLPIEGVVGHFALHKAGTWVIRAEEVVEI